jgi:hypothetical protein
MKTPKQITDELIGRMKTTELNWFAVQRPVGENWLPTGSIPFDVSATNGVATFTVWAISLTDAESQVTDFLEKH